MKLLILTIANNSPSQRRMIPVAINTTFIEGLEAREDGCKVMLNSHETIFVCERFAEIVDKLREF